MYTDWHEDCLEMTEIEIEIEIDIGTDTASGALFQHVFLLTCTALSKNSTVEHPG